MALPVEFWRSDQMVNVFRTRPCKRLIRNGFCEWGSQCQFSHNLSWPRRQPQKHRYTPELCPHVQLALGGAGGAEAGAGEACAAGLRCPRAHSTEEALYHPRLLKTVLCEEHAALAQTAPGAPGRAARLPGARCHRYYCPFAHGEQELRPSSLSPRQRERCLQAVRALGRARGGCCEVCDPPQLGHAGGELDALDGHWGAQGGAAGHWAAPGGHWGAPGGHWGAREPDLAAQEAGQGAGGLPQGGAVQRQGSGPLVAFRPFPVGDFVGYAGGAAASERGEAVPAPPEQCRQVLLSPMPGPPAGALLLPLPAQGGASGCDMAGAACHAAVRPAPSPGSPACSSDGGLEQHRGLPAQSSQGLPCCAEPWRPPCAPGGPAGGAAGTAAAGGLGGAAAGGVPLQAILVNGYGHWAAVPAPWGQAAAIFVPQLPFSPAQPSVAPQEPTPQEPTPQATGRGSVRRRGPAEAGARDEEPEPLVMTPPPGRMERLTTPSDDGFEPWATPPRRAAAGARWPGAPAEVK